MWLPPLQENHITRLLRPPFPPLAGGFYFLPFFVFLTAVFFIP
jgi:hypothetical protein